jgi:hypothetical protein
VQHEGERLNYPSQDGYLREVDSSLCRREVELSFTSQLSERVG